MKIYHNPRCSKSRQGLEILKNSGHEFEVVDYLHHPPSKIELKEVLNMLGLTPIQLVRKNEAIWKENYRNKELTDDAIIEAMCEHPKLIERPIVIRGNHAVLGRPPENIEKFL